MLAPEPMRGFVPGFVLGFVPVQIAADAPSPGCLALPSPGPAPSEAAPAAAERIEIALPAGVRVWLANGHSDMRRGMNGLALQVQQALHRDPHAGDLWVFRGRRGDLVTILWHDGTGMSLYAKRLATGPLRVGWRGFADPGHAFDAAGRH